MDKILSIRSNNQIFSLFSQIQEFQKSANRTEIVNASILKAINDTVNWLEISNTKFPVIPAEQIDIPNFIQLRVNADEYNLLATQMHDQFHLEKMPPAPYVIKLVLTNYLIYLYDMYTKSLHNKSDNPQSSPNTILTPNEFNELTSVDEKLNHLYRLLYETKVNKL